MFEIKNKELSNLDIWGKINRTEKTCKPHGLFSYRNCVFTLKFLNIKWVQMDVHSTKPLIKYQYISININCHTCPKG